MNEHTKQALQIQLDEIIKNRDNLIVMSEQYKSRAKTIDETEIPELEEKLRAIRSDLE